MNCERIQSELVAFHFGVIDDDVRGELELHLVCCRGCLRSYLALKRDIELAESGPQPSLQVFDRLRRSAARELASPSLRRWSWWERPFAFGFAAALALGAMGAVTALARTPGSAPRGLDVSPTVPAPADRR